MLKNECSRNCWLAAAVAGLLVWIFSGAFFSGLVLGLITAFLLGNLLIWGLCEGRGGRDEDAEVLGAKAATAPAAQTDDDAGVLHRAEQAVVDASSAFASGAVTAAEKGRETVREWLKDDDDHDREDRRDDDHTSRKDRDDDDDDDDGLLDRAEDRLEQAGEAVKDAMGAIAARGKEAISNLTGDKEDSRDDAKAKGAEASDDRKHGLTAAASSGGTVSPSGQSAMPATQADAPASDDVSAKADAAKADDHKADTAKPDAPKAEKSEAPKPEENTTQTDAADNRSSPAPAQASADAGGEDDLKLIKGIGPALETQLHENGIHSFAQIAAWSEEDIDHFAEVIGRMGGRIRSDDWVAQARVLAEGGETEFSRRVDDGEVY